MKAVATFATIAISSLIISGCNQQNSSDSPSDNSDITSSTAPHIPTHSADLVLTNAKVYTVNPKQAWATTVAIGDGKIIYVGDEAGSQAHIGKATQVSNLNGQMVLPGFHDAHVHPAAAGIMALQCDLTGVEGIEALQAAIKAYAEAHPDKPWIIGGGWDVFNFPPSGLPDKKLLDAIIPDRPVALTSSDGHSLWVNSKALEMSSVSATSAEPSGGRIDRYPNSKEPSGSLQEPPAMNLTLSHAPKLSPDDILAGLSYARDLFHRYGITGVQDAWVEPSPGTHYYSLDAYNTLDARNELNLHVSASLYWHPDQSISGQLDRFIALRNQQADNHIRTSTVKIMQDGVLEVHTAALLEPYSDRSDGHKGALFNSPEDLNKAVTEIDKHGFQIHFHAIGDHAIRSSLNAIELAQKTNGSNNQRHHISHLEQFNPADIPRLKALDVTANFQPLWSIKDEYVTQLTIPKIGDERAEWLYALGSVQRSGARIAFGSDWYVSSANPLEGIEVAVSRLDPDGATVQPLGSNQELSLAQAIESYTLNSAYLNHMDHKVGSIETGKLADLIVLDNNLFDIPTKEINQTKVTATLFAGKLVYGEL